MFHKHYYKLACLILRLIRVNNNVGQPLPWEGSIPYGNENKFISQAKNMEKKDCHSMGCKLYHLDIIVFLDMNTSQIHIFMSKILSFLRN